MLRSAVIGFGIFLLGCSALALVSRGYPSAFACLFWGGLIVAGVVFERVYYKPLESAAPGPGWQKTTERFIDDETGAPVTVFIDPQTGERKYVRD